MEEIQIGVQGITQRVAVASALRHQLNQQVEELKAEIASERSRRNAFTLQKALYVSRIIFDLRLVQQLAAYIEGLDRRIGYFNTALHKLEFFRRQVQDDLLLLQALNDLSINELIRQIGSALNEFNARSNEPLIVSSQMQQPSLEAIWNGIPSSK